LNIIAKVPQPRASDHERVLTKSSLWNGEKHGLRGAAVGLAGLAGRLTSSKYFFWQKQQHEILENAGRGGFSYHVKISCGGDRPWLHLDQVPRFIRYLNKRNKYCGPYRVREYPTVPKST
jgi:hypothetical protein